MTETDSQPIAENEQVKELLALLKDNNTPGYGSQRGRSLVRGCPDDGFRHATAGYKKKYPLSLRRQYRTQRWFSGHGQPERMD